MFNQDRIAHLLEMYAESHSNLDPSEIDEEYTNTLREALFLLAREICTGGLAEDCEEIFYKYVTEGFVEIPLYPGAEDEDVMFANTPEEIVSQLFVWNEIHSK